MPKTAPKPATPSIAAMPDPDPVKVLHDRIAELTNENSALQRRIETVTSEAVRWKEKLKSLQSNRFILALNSIDAGALADEAAEKLKTLTAEVVARQEKGKISLAFTIKPFKVGSVTFEPELKVIAPPTSREKGLFFATPEGDISRSNPNQRELNLSSNGDRSDAAVEGDQYQDEEQLP
jgi:hypothetical protein